jgi:rSAM/selenodomain-associated transferase 2
VTLSIVIPTLNEADRIVGTVESAKVSDAEIVVVDGDSHDGTPELAASAGARVIVSPGGRAAQLAAGALAARGEVILFLHADTRLLPGFDDAVACALADPDFVGGAFRFQFDRSSPALNFVQWGARLRVALFTLPYGDQGIFVRRRALEAIGGIPQVPLMEDLDLVAALRRVGRLKILALPAITSARRYQAAGVFRTVFRHFLAVGARWLGVDRARIASWYAS